MADDIEGAGSYRTAKKSDGLARTLATIALILSILALVWAAKAASKADDAMTKADNINNTIPR